MSAATQPTDLESLSRYLGFASQHIFYLVGNADKLYFEIEIPKKSTSLSHWNNTRKISIPVTDLKGVQRVILSSILSHVPISEHSYAYVKGRSVTQAAQKLCGGKSVLKIDLSNFFPTVTSKRVFGMFRSLGFNNDVCFMLTKLTTYKGTLCQGAPTSPAISNIICRKMDLHLDALSKKWKMNFIRYSDDIFFYKQKNFKYAEVLSAAKRVIVSHGFTVNDNKTKYCPLEKPRYTLGLVTHGQSPQLPRKTRREYRAAFFRASRDINWATENLERLVGMAEWYKCVYGFNQNYENYKRVIRNVRAMRLHNPYSTKTKS
jgi:hypothetical protein